MKSINSLKSLSESSSDTEKAFPVWNKGLNIQKPGTSPQGWGERVRRPWWWQLQIPELTVTKIWKGLKHTRLHVQSLDILLFSRTQTITSILDPISSSSWTLFHLSWTCGYIKIKPRELHSPHSYILFIQR